MKVKLAFEGPAAQGETEEFAQRLGVELVDVDDPAADLLLVRTADRLELREGMSHPSPVSLAVDFRASARSPLLVRATLAGREGVDRIIDATAGLGQDAFVLAQAGCRVDLIERSPVVAALLEDALARARRNDRLRAAAQRMTLHVGESRQLLQQLPPAPVVYLDPMYPRSGREGGKAKGMRLLRELLGGDEDAGSLLDVARRVATRRVTVKRPRRAPPLAGEKPSGTLDGTTVRFDLYAPSS